MGPGRIAGLALVVALCSCVADNNVYCTDGRVCPIGKQCEYTLGLCITADQLGQCDPAMPGMPCTFGADGVGECVGEVCVPPECGDGVRSGTEECDGDDLDGKTSCLDVGYYKPGPIGCRADCRFDVKDCHERCGDKILQEQELCEPTLSVPTGTCLDFGFDFGAINCASTCIPGFTNCKRIGWNRMTNLGVEWQAAWAAPNGTVFAVGPDKALAIIDGAPVQSTLPASQPQNRYLRAVWGSSDTDVWAVGSFGVWWHRDASGDWTLLRTEPNVLYDYDLYAVWGASANSIYAVGFQGRVVHYDGMNWTPSSINTGGGHLIAIWGSGASDIYAATNNAMYHFNGSWSAVTTGIASDTYRGIWGTAANDVYVVGDGGVQHFDGSWKYVLRADVSDGENCGAISGLGPNEVYVGCSSNSGNSIYRFDGASWSRMEIAAFSTALAGTTTMYAVGNEVYRFARAGWSRPLPFANNGPFAGFGLNNRGTELTLTQNELLRYDQANWKVVAGVPAVSPVANNRFKAVWNDATGQVAIAEATSGKVHHFNGSGWTTRVAIAGSTIEDMWGSSASDLWVVGSLGIAHFDGASWTTTDATDSIAIDGTATSGPFVLTRAGGVLRRDTSAWTAIATPVSVSLVDIYAPAGDSVFAVGAGGAIVHYDGVAWSSMMSGETVDFQHIAGSSGTDVFVSGTAATAIHYDGTAWGPTEIAPYCGMTIHSVAVRADTAFFGCIGTTVALVRMPTW